MTFKKYDYYFSKLRSYCIGISIERNKKGINDHDLETIFLHFLWSILIHLWIERVIKVGIFFSLSLPEPFQQFPQFCFCFPHVVWIVLHCRDDFPTPCRLSWWRWVRPWSSSARVHYNRSCRQSRPFLPACGTTPKQID